MKNKKYYVLYHGGADYSVSDVPDNYGSCEEVESFSEAKKLAIAKAKNDIEELRSTIKYLKSLKRSKI